jgi:hypothetical protein
MNGGIEDGKGENVCHRIENIPHHERIVRSG